MGFEKCTEIMTKCFNTLHKDPDQWYSDQQKVEKLLKAIKCQDSELLAAKAVIDQQFPRDYIGACRYFSRQVARIHGPAHLEYRNTRNKKRGIYAIDSRSQRGGRGRSRISNRGGRGGCGRGGRNQASHIINGIDMSDPNRSFSAQEWEALGPNNGRNIVLQMRERANGQGHQDGRGRGRG